MENNSVVILTLLGKLNANKDGAGFTYSPACPEAHLIQSV